MKQPKFNSIERQMILSGSPFMNNLLKHEKSKKQIRVAIVKALYIKQIVESISKWL